MTAAKTPPERITRYWDERVGSLMHKPYPGDTPVEYILASVVEKREQALRDALHAVTELHVQPCECAGCAALAAADEGEEKR